MAAFERGHAGVTREDAVEVFGHVERHRLDA